MLLALTLVCQQRRNAEAQAPVQPNVPTSLSAKPVADTLPKVVRPHVPTPDTLRGIYVNRWAALGRKLNSLIGIAKRTEVNALVIDVKDDRGFVLYRSNVPLAREIGADTADGHYMSSRKLRAALDTMIANDIYPIARIVVAKDPILARKKLDLAIKRKTDQKPWLDKLGNPWLDPHQPAVWQYAADLAKEAYELGFSEVQFDYVRFPDEKRLEKETVYPLAEGRPRDQVIKEQLAFLRKELAPIVVGADVFGFTATDTTEMGIGQRWEMFIDQVDVVLPMVYPSHFTHNSYEIRYPNAHPYETLDHAFKDMKARSAPFTNTAKIIPWYQDFTLGPPRYGVAQIRAQMQAGYDNGLQSWILWNPKSNYTVAALQPQR
ncbi:MAG TPA: putative glycoside hydrolase [Gemmatimonadaceae bacterium]|nr:putative glycoside hydrolase [Gemmatimonadaceae bacterium]